MKKTYWILLLLFFAGCTLKGVDSSDYANVIPIPITLTSEHFFAYDRNLNFFPMLFFDENGIVIHDVDWDRPGFDVVRILPDGSFYNIYSFKGGVPRWRALAFDSYGNHYYPIVVRQENFTEHFAIVRLNSNKYECTENDSTIVWESEYNIIINFFIENDIMIIYDPNNVGSYRKGNIVRLDLDDNFEQVIITKIYCMISNIGDFIVDIFVENTNIYIFRIAYGDNGERHFIDVYDFYGNKIKSYPIDLQDFMSIKMMGDRDIEWGFLKFNDYFIISTLGRRVAIFNLAEGELTRVELYSAFENFNFTLFMDVFLGDNSGLMYFPCGMGEGKKIYVLDSSQKQLFLFDITIQYPKWSNYGIFMDWIALERDKVGNMMLYVQVVGWDEHTRLVDQLKQDAISNGKEFDYENFPKPLTYFYYFLCINEIKRILE